MVSFPNSDQNDLETFLRQYELGNTVEITKNYTARTHHTCHFQLDNVEQRKSEPFLLLTVEPTALDRLTFTALFLEHLTEQGVPIAPCLKNRQGEYISQYDQFPALLFALPSGNHPEKPNEKICSQIGAFLGTMHTSSANFNKTYGNPRSLVWLNLSADELIPQLSIGDASLLKEQLERFKNTIDSKPNLPTGPLIGSLFKDQLFFQGETLEAVTGFYFSCTDWLLLDVAQAVNEWCCNEQGELDKHLTNALLSAYHEERPFTPCESQYWQDILCFSATRFWVSRLLTSLIPDRAGCPSIRHNPNEYRQKLRRRITGYCPLPK